MSPSSGSGVGDPILPGAPGSDEARPIPYTLLSLSRYAALMGINPMHFCRGATPGLSPIVMPGSTCSSVWFKYDWQNNDQVSWMQIASAIQQAEAEIAEVCGFWPAPTWIEAEAARFPRPYDRTAYGMGVDVRGAHKTVSARYSKLIGPGRRAVTLVGTASVAGGTLVYSDNDGDGFTETARITLPTTATDKRQIKVYYAGALGERDYEVRPVRKITLGGGSVTLTLDSWLLIRPELYDDLPTDEGLAPIDISTTANFVTSVDVYVEGFSPSLAEGVFRWEQGQLFTSGCAGEMCGFVEQDACLNLRDEAAGLFSPAPVAYDAVTGSWSRVAFAEVREPDSVLLYYLSGEQDSRFLQGQSTDPLSEFWAQTIAWLATARIDRPLCGCGNAGAIADDLRVELTSNSREASFFVTADVQTCPFGTRKGEVMAWRRIKRIARGKQLGTALA